LSDPQSPDRLANSICAGIVKLGMVPDEFPVAACVRYLGLLKQWNRAYNLTAIREPERMVTYHILDSLSVLPYLNGDRCIDVGTGAGVPGLILALATPRKQWVLLDSNRKKIRFLNQVIIELNVGNVSMEKARAEAFKPHRLFSTVITRAYGSLNLICKHTRHLLAPDGSLLAMKGAVSGEELAGIDSSVFGVRIHELQVPGIAEQRSLVEIRHLLSSG